MRRGGQGGGQRGGGVGKLATRGGAAQRGGRGLLPVLSFSLLLCASSYWRISAVLSYAGIGDGSSAVILRGRFVRYLTRESPSG